MSDKAPTGRVGLVFGSLLIVAFLSLWESSGNLITTVYADKLAGGLPTVCDGLTRHITSTPIVVGEQWSVEKCESEQRAALIKVQRQLLKCFIHTPPQSVFDAATSHAWNMGATATCGSVAMQNWNKGNWATGCNRLAIDADGRPVWSYVRTGRTLPNGKPEMRFVQGLANRRQAEVKLCMAGVQ